MLSELSGSICGDEEAIYASGHIRQPPPTDQDLILPDTLSPPLVARLCHSMVGAEVYLARYLGHTVMPEAVPQPVHADWEPLWPHHRSAHPPWIFSVNIAVVDTDDANGAIEVWPGSHRCTGATTFRPASLAVTSRSLRLRRWRRPPRRVAMATGDVLVRDARLWHRGTTNATTTPRPMLFLIFAANWFATDVTLTLPSHMREQIENLDVRVQCIYSEEI
jgi:ectoine hydroxylase-related dioxygenase (phytanoyl-CoA dioxygenase family)